MKTLTKPFKANGREIQITKPEDMISLMQKGLNYVKNMTELKPLKSSSIPSSLSMVLPKKIWVY